MENLTPLQEIAEKYYLETQENIRLMKENMVLMDEIDKCRKRSIEMADYGLKACAAIHRLTVENKELRKINSGLALRVLSLELENIELEKKAHEAINELLTELEWTRESGKRYAMTKDQPAQIDCVVSRCLFYAGGGKCSNISPAISLNNNGTFTCWSYI
jgi:hypothetical protein